MTSRWGFVAAAVVTMWLLSASEAAAQACTILVTSVAFGSYNVFNTSALDSSGSITYNCNNKANNISISLGKGSSSTFSPRRMTQGGEALSYNLYMDASRTTIWGDGTSGTSVYTRNNPPNNTNVTLPIYGRVTAAQDVSGGTYSDTVLATINF
jgi:spore coat protein U-like protein